MIQSLLRPGRLRQLLISIFLVGSSAAAGWSIYHGKMKVVAILGLITLGIFLRLASFANAYLLALFTASLGLVRFDPIHTEFDQDKWLALFLMTALSAAVVLFSMGRPVLPRPVHILVVALVALSAWSVSYSVMPSLSLEKAGVFSCVLFIAYAGIWTAARTRADAVRIVEVHIDSLWVVWPICVMSVPLLGGDAYMAGRFRSVFINPNNLGFWASLSVPLLAGMALTHPVRWRRITCGAMAAIGFGSTFLAGSRGGMIGAALGILLYAVLRFPKRTISMLAFGGIVLTFLLLYGVQFEMPNSLAAILRPESVGDLSNRRIWWQIGTLIWSQRPWLGHGFGITDLLFSHYGLDVAKPGTFGATVHNSYLEAGMNIGWIGLSLVIAIQAWSAWVALRTWRRDRDGQIGLTSLALLCVIVAVSAHASIESALFAAGNPWSLPFWVTTALVHRLAAIQAAEQKVIEQAARAAPA